MIWPTTQLLALLLVSIYSGGIITATMLNEGSVRCGQLLCRPVTGVFVDNPMQEGYTRIATIPIGSSNISITELKDSSNRLAIRVIDEDIVPINGDRDDPTASGTYELANAMFDYRQLALDDDPYDDDEDDSAADNALRRREQPRRTAVTEWMTSQGPIAQAIDILVLALEHNPGVRYEYLVPTVATNEHLPPSSDEYVYDSNESPESTGVAVLRSNSVGRLASASASPSSTTSTTSTTERPRHRRRRRPFTWKITGFAECTRSCGGGIQMPVIRCVREQPTLRMFIAKKCAHLPRPNATEHAIRCNSHACAAIWKATEWSQCDCSVQLQRREAKCVQELNSGGVGMLMQVPAAACTEPRPPLEQPCKQSCRPAATDARRSSLVAMVADQAAKTPAVGSRPLRRPRVHGASLHRHPDKHSNNVLNAEPTASDKDRGVWLASDWSNECAESCRAPLERRTIFCDRPSKFAKRCELARTPETVRACSARAAACAEATGEWLVGDWSPCTGDCFNVTQTRTVRCYRDGQLSERSACPTSGEPEAWRSCSMEGVPHCQSHWHYSLWSECTKPCDGGTQRRTVKCLRPNGSAMRESDGCKYAERLPMFQACNVHVCQAPELESDEQQQQQDEAPAATSVDTHPDCVDTLPNCDVVQLQHLCGTSYFQAHCCATCSTSRKPRS